MAGGLFLGRKFCPPVAMFVVSDASPSTRRILTDGIRKVVRTTGSVDTEKPHDFDREASNLKRRGAVYFTFLSAGFNANVNAD